jgi:hypothetical protein
MFQWAFDPDYNPIIQDLLFTNADKNKRFCQFYINGATKTDGYSGGPQKISWCFSQMGWLL